MKTNSMVNVLDNNEHLMNEKDVCFIRPENVHYINTYKNTAFEYYNLLVKKEFFISLVNQISSQLLVDDSLDSPRYITLEAHAHADIIYLLDTAIGLSVQSVVERQKLLRLAVMKLVSALFMPKKDNPESNDLVTQVINIMSTPENMHLPLRKIAEKVNFCQEHIIRTFKKNGLEKPNLMFMRIKLEYAQSLLCSSDIGTADIAEQIGISNVNYFNKLFKRFYGVSPSVYRKNNSIKF